MRFFLFEDDRIKKKIGKAFLFANNFEAREDTMNPEASERTWYDFNRRRRSRKNKAVFYGHDPSIGVQQEHVSRRDMQVKLAKDAGASLEVELARFQKTPLAWSDQRERSLGCQARSKILEARERSQSVLETQQIKNLVDNIIGFLNSVQQHDYLLVWLFESFGRWRVGALEH